MPLSLTGSEKSVEFHAHCDGFTKQIRSFAGLINDDVLSKAGELFLIAAKRADCGDENAKKASIGTFFFLH